MARSRLVKKLTRRGSNISVSRRAVLCRLSGHRQFAAGLALATEERSLALVRTFGMIMLAEICQRATQRGFTEQNQLRKTFTLDRVVSKNSI
jgi:hypothetical protein